MIYGQEQYGLWDTDLFQSRRPRLQELCEHKIHLLILAISKLAYPSRPQQPNKQHRIEICGEKVADRANQGRRAMDSRGLIGPIGKVMSTVIGKIPEAVCSLDSPPRFDH